MSECRHICCWDLMLVWGWKTGKCVEEHGWCQKQAKNKTNFQEFSNELWYLFAAVLYSDNQNTIINAFTSVWAPLCWWPVNKASCAINSSQCPGVLGREEKLRASKLLRCTWKGRMLQTEACPWAPGKFSSKFQFPFFLSLFGQEESFSAEQNVILRLSTTLFFTNWCLGNTAASHCRGHSPLWEEQDPRSSRGCRHPVPGHPLRSVCSAYIYLLIF